MEYDFSGWATRNNVKCSDGRIIRRNAFADNDGQRVPLVWNHDHNDPSNVLGHAVLENRDEGVYAYCKLNDTEKANYARALIKHGDIDQFSIYANKLKQKGSDVLHGAIREVSLVLAGANPEAYIENVMMHSDDGDYFIDEAVIYPGEGTIEHADGDAFEESNSFTIKHANSGSNKQEETGMNNEKTVAEVFDELTEEQKTVVYALIGQALEDAQDDDDDEGDEEMKQSVFDQDYDMPETVLTHSDEIAIMARAKKGTFKEALTEFAEENDYLEHGFADEDLDVLFPDYKDVYPGAPELLTRDYTWVGTVMNGVHKSPISRIRTRQMDARAKNLEALGYKTKGAKKNEMPNVKLLKRTTDPQTVYIKDKLNRDDILDLTDFDVVEYQYGIMKGLMNETLAKAILIGDGRQEGDADKIEESHIRPIWKDDELYCMHADVDIAAARKELQGTNTSANFGDNYVYAEAVISATLYARENYKGSGSLTMFCTPHMLNKMLLARDLNGRRIYNSKSDLEAALNVSSIETVEQFEGQQRTDKQGKKHNLLALFVNLKDYQVGSTKGGEITRFSQFDIDFNQEKYLIETRLSGALTRVFSAIALEEPVVE